MFVEHKEAGETKEAPAKTLKLSEAIRIGAKLLPQGAGCFYLGGKTCAIGAAFHAVHGYPSCSQDVVDYAMHLPLGTGLLMQIYCRNDAGFSRESIADWLESQGY